MFKFSFCELNYKQGFSANINIYKARYIMCVFYAGYCYYPYFLQNNILITLSISDSVPFLFQKPFITLQENTLCGEMGCRNLQTTGNFKSVFHFKTWGYQTIQCPARKSNNKALQHGFFPGRVERKEAVHHTNKGNSLHFFASTVF